MLFCFILLQQVLAITQKEILLDFYQSTDGPNWYHNDNWDTDEDICSWYGVVCTGKLVTNITLQGNNLHGKIPENFGYLYGLEQFDCTNNTLEGPIPRSMQNMRNLKRLQLRLNNLTGEFPMFLSTAMVQFHLDYNQFTGQLSEAIGRYTNLAILGLTNSHLTGPIPKALGQLRNLNTLLLAGNKFTGEIPSALAYLSKIVLLDLSSNELTGTIPDIFGNLGNLQEFSVSNNKLVGALPGSIMAPRYLQVITAANNQLTSVPTNLGAHPALSVLDLRNNQINQLVPPSLAQTNSENDSRVIIAVLSGNPWKCPLPPNVAWTKAECTPDHTHPVSFLPLENEGEEGKGEERRRRRRKEVEAEVEEARKKKQEVEVEVEEERRRRRKGNAKIKVEYCGITKCPDMVELERNLTVVHNDLADFIEIETLMMTNPNPTTLTGRWCMHGQMEVVGAMAQKCARKVEKAGGGDGAKYRAFLACAGEKYAEIPSRTMECAKIANLDYFSVRDCMRSATAIEDLVKDQERVDSLHGVWSPTLYIDGEEVCMYNTRKCATPSHIEILAEICSRIPEDDRPIACKPPTPLS